MKVKVFVLEIYRNGQWRVWHEALPAKTAFAAARLLARDGFKPIILRIDLTREQYLKLDPKEIVAKIRA